MSGRPGLIAVLGCLWALAVSLPAAGQAPTVVPLAWDSAALDRMVRAIADYQRLAEGDGWPRLPPSSSSMRPNWVDPRVPALRQRLIATGDLPATEAATGTVVDPATVAAVARFQVRHGLIADGIAGRRTIEIMNVPASERAAQLMLNYDRLRAMARSLPATGIVVNVPATALQLMVDGEVVLTSRVVVGRRDWRTPSVRGAIEEIEINPYWNIPPRIAQIGVVPRVVEDRGYLAANAIRVIGPTGEVPADSVDWVRFPDLGYRLRQDPGGNNPLGAFKFVFLNRYAVLLHDTPTKHVFARPDRALSHGCVRVERAFDLAIRLLDDDPQWTAASLREAVALVRNRRVRLAQSVPVSTVYVTAWSAADGSIHVRSDIYGEDSTATTTAASIEPVACGNVDADDGTLN